MVLPSPDPPELFVMVDPIANLKSPEGSLVSIYLDRPSPGGFPALISDLGRVARQEVATKPRALQKSVDADLTRLRDMADRFEAEVAPAYALFASSLNGIWELQALPQPTSPVAVVGARPYLRPLRAVPRPIRTAILVADRSQARLFVGFDGELEEIEPPIAAEIGKSNFGGFSGYDEHGVRARAQDVASRLWRTAGDKLLERHLETPFDLLLIGGLNESVEDIRNQLHPYLADLPIDAFAATPTDVSVRRLKEEMATQRLAYRRDREIALVDDLLALAGRGNRGLIGLAAAVAAVNAQAVADLVVAGEFARPGVLCPQCGYMDRSGTKCTVCGSGFHEVRDLVSAIMDATVASGGRVHQLTIGSALDRHGIGAIARFELPVS